MNSQIHKKITLDAVGLNFSSRALKVVIHSNIYQDNPWAQVFHNEYHFDNNKLSQGFAYLSGQTQLCITAIEERKFHQAWRIFGKLVHNIQDFYAHSNYVNLFLEISGGEWPEPAAIIIEHPGIMANPALHTHTAYFPMDYIGILPWMAMIARKVLPLDSHAHMNLDGPGSGSLFPYAYAAAVKHTHSQFQLIVKAVNQRSPGSLPGFLDRLS